MVARNDHEGYSLLNGQVDDIGESVAPRTSRENSSSFLSQPGARAIEMNIGSVDERDSGPGD